MSLPLNSKITLINKYIQVNNMKDRGRAEHDDFLVKDLLTSVIDDLKKFHQPSDETHLDLGPVVQDLKTLKESQSNPEVSLTSIVDDLQKLIEIQSNPPINLSTIIQELEASIKK